MTESIYLVRHAQSIGNQAGSYSVPNAGYLSETGMQQAQSLAEQLKDEPIDRVVSSPLIRAMETVKPYLETTEREGEIWAELAEGCFQQPEFDTEVSLRYGDPIDLDDNHAKWFSLNPDEYPARSRPEDETFAESFQRVKIAASRIERLFETSTDESILVVAHYHYLARLTERLLAIEPNAEKRFKFDNVSVTKLIRQPDSANGQFALRWSTTDVDT